MNPTPPNHTNPDAPEPHQTPADLMSVAALLDRDAADLRQLPLGAIDRIAAAVASANLAAPAAKPALRLVATERAIGIYQFQRVTAPLRTAAAILLALTVGVLGVAYLSSISQTPVKDTATVTPSTSTPLDPTQEADSILSTLAMLESASTELSALDSDADAVSKSIGADWLTLPEPTETGAM